MVEPAPRRLQTPRTNNLQRWLVRQWQGALALAQAAFALRYSVLTAWVLWALAILLPLLFLYPKDGTDLPAVWWLAALQPLAVLGVAATGQPLLVLGVALGGLLPVLVACPALTGPRTTGLPPALAIAAGALAVVHAGLRAARPLPTDLRRLLAFPTAPRERFLVGLLLLWLVLALWLPDGAGEALRPERARAVRAGLAGGLWLAVAVVPLAGETPAEGRDRWSSYAIRRAIWGALLGGLWLLWRSGEPPG